VIDRVLSPAERAERNIEWCERYLFLPEGRNVGQRLQMAAFMQDDFRAIYGNPAGTRRAIISRGRKNAKSVECASILLLHLCGPEYRPNGALYSCAQSRDQAAIIFRLASKMVRMSPILRRVVKIRESAKELLCPGVGTSYKALSAETSTAFGLSPVLTIHDELGQVKGPRFPLYEALETATAAQDEPLTLVISTQAPTDADLLSMLIDDALTGADPRTVIRLNTAPMDADPFAEATIAKANPALLVFMNKAEVLAMAEDARRLPAREAEFRNLILNQRVEASNPFVTPNIWKACGAPVLPFSSTTPLYAGLDLSSVADLTALVMIGQPDAKKWHVHPTFWLPRGAGGEIAYRPRALRSVGGARPSADDGRLVDQVRGRRQDFARLVQPLQHPQAGLRPLEYGAPEAVAGEGRLRGQHDRRPLRRIRAGHAKHVAGAALAGGAAARPHDRPRHPPCPGDVRRMRGGRGQGRRQPQAQQEQVIRPHRRSRRAGDGGGGGAADASGRRRDADCVMFVLAEADSLFAWIECVLHR
jgi:hypothetical protein